MKLIEVLTDLDYDVYNPHVNGETSKFSRLHQETKDYLLGKQNQEEIQGKRLISTPSESTKI